MLEFVAGVAVGAVFAPFWLAIWKKLKDVAASGTVDKP
jgi:hypothetical protein